METKKINIMHYFIAALLIFGFRFLPPFGEMTSYGMGVLGTFIGAVYGWSFIGMTWTSLMALVGLGLVVGMPTMLASVFGNPAVAMMFGALPLMAVLSDLHVTEYLANKIFTNKLSLGRPWIAITILFLGAYASAFINPVLSILIFAVFIIELCKNCGIEPYTKLPTTLMMGLAYAIMLGQIFLPFLGTGLTFTAAYAGMFGMQMPYISYMLFIIPMGIVMTIVYILLMRLVLRVDVSPLAKMTADIMGASQKMNNDQKLALVFFIAYVIVMMLSSILPAGNILADSLSALSIFGISIVFAATMMTISRTDGTPLLDYGKMAKNFAWEPFLLTAYIMVTSSYLTSAEVGLNATISALIAPMTQLSPFIFVVIVLLFATIITNVANNLILTIIIMPVMYNFAAIVDMNATGLIMILFLSTQLALATPGASPITGIACAQSSIVMPADFSRNALIVIPILFLINLIIGYVWMNIVF